jgi:hypothetical protein
MSNEFQVILPRKEAVFLLCTKLAEQLDKEDIAHLLEVGNDGYYYVDRETIEDKWKEVFDETLVMTEDT